MNGKVKETTLFAIVTENDSANWLVGRGAIIWEGPCDKQRHLEDVLDRAKGLGNQYGRVLICRLEPIGSVDEVEAVLRRGKLESAT